MTAEVAVLNKSAVALAADSLVTISRGGTGEKTYNVNKLFTLSKYHPVGIMVYDNADLFGVPWETIIKEYRHGLATKSFPTAKEYLNDFLQFISKSRKLFPAATQRKHYLGSLIALYMMIKDEATKEIKALTTGGKTIAKKKIREVYEDNIEQLHNFICSRKRIDGLHKDYEKKLLATYSSEVAKAKKIVFDTKLGLKRPALKKLRDLAAASYTRGFPPLGKTGVVVAGFGDNETFPSANTVSVHGVLRNELLYNDEKEQSYQLDGLRANEAVVIPFAQTDVVNTFLRGIDPDFFSEILDAIDNVLNDISSVITSHVKGVKGKKVAIDFSKKKDLVLKNFTHSLREYSQERHVGPLIEVVSFLPKDELAATAAALVELTSIKRKMSRGLETVGGPVDVAVISKGDGFVWISRKHYFKPDLNPHFMETYFRK